MINPDQQVGQILSGAAGASPGVPHSDSMGTGAKRPRLRLNFDVSVILVNIVVGRLTTSSLKARRVLFQE